MVRTRSICLILVSIGLLVLGFAFPTPLLHAQSLSGIQSGATLQVSPQFPSPHTSVTVSLDAYSLNTFGGTFRWYVDGKELVERKNERSVSFLTGDIGAKHAVRSVISFASRPSIETTIAIPVGAVDIIIESDTYTPSFYKGRALPSEGSPIRAVAITNTKGVATPFEYVYEWKLDGNLLFGGPIGGKQVAELTMPLYDDHRLSVTVYDKNKVVLGKRTITLVPAQPMILFYEENPLRGLSRKAVTQNFTLVGEETTVYAEPYFMNAAYESFSGDVSWTLNNTPVNPTGDRPNAITLRHTGGEGSARIGFRYVIDDISLQYVEKAFSIFFK